MATIGSLVVDLKAETAAFRRDFAAAHQSTMDFNKSITSSISRLKDLAVGFLTIHTAIGVYHQLAEAGMDAEKAQARLEGVLRATGDSAGYTAKQIDAIATAMMGRTIFDDETIKNAAAALLTFHNITGSTFKDTLSLAADMASLFDGDLSSAAVQLGKAMDDPIQGMQTLRKVGITLSPVMKDHIKNLEESGHLYEAQQVLLGALQAKFGGVADALGNNPTSLLAATAHMTQQWHELLEQWGKSDSFAGTAVSAIHSITSALALLGGVGPEVANQMALDEVSAKVADMRAGFKGLQADLLDVVNPNSADEMSRLTNQERFYVEMKAKENELKREATRLAKEHFDALKAEASADKTRPGPQGETEEARKKRLAILDKAAADALDDYTRASKEYQQQYNQATADNLSATEDMLRVQDDLLAASQRVDEARLKGAQESAQTDVKIWNNAVENIQNNFASAFEQMLTGQVKSFQDFVKLILTTWAQTLAQMAAQQAATSLFGGFMQSALTLPGISGPSFGGFDIPTPSISRAGVASTSHVTNVSNYHIHAIDTQSFAQAVQQNRATVAAIAVQAVQGSRAVQGLMARGRD